MSSEDLPETRSLPIVYINESLQNPSLIYIGDAYFYQILHILLMINTCRRLVHTESACRRKVLVHISNIPDLFISDKRNSSFFVSDTKCISFTYVYLYVFLTGDLFTNRRTYRRHDFLFIIMI